MSSIAFRPLLAAMLLAAALLPARGFADPTAEDQLGTIRFDVTGKSDARVHVIRGVKLVHHMMYPEADQEFAAAAAADPSCALAYWGRALTLLHPLWPDAPSDADRQRGAELLRVGLATPPRTPRERDYLETLDVFFNAATPGDYPTRLKALDVAWSTFAARYPDDLDALAFSALFHLAPARFIPKDKTNRIQLEAANRLERVAKALPEHPGGMHYLIHAFDFPLLAARALEVCDSYSSIAPEVPHALHMPTHIFTRRGLWERSIEFNRRSADAGRKLAASAGAMNSHVPHALDYLAYAYLQRGQYREAEAVRRQLLEIKGPYVPGALTQIGFACSAVPARYALERQAWAEAAALPLHQPADFPWGQRFVNCDAMVHYARAIGAVRSGQLDAARAELAEQERVRQDLAAANPVSYWAAQAETQLLATRAWLAFADQKTDEAISLMRRAVQIEATTDKEAVTPGEVLPAGDLLGDLLLEAGQPGEALAAYEAVLKASPNRLNTLYGAGFAAERSGNPTKARDYYGQLLQIAVDADRGIPRIEHAREYLRGNLTAIAGHAEP